MTTGPEFFAAPLGQQLLPSSASLQALKGWWLWGVGGVGDGGGRRGEERSWPSSCLAERRLGDGDRQACCASRVAKPAETPSSQLLPANAKLAP